MTFMQIAIWPRVAWREGGEGPGVAEIIRTDLCVMGAGAAGLSVAAGAAARFGQPLAPIVPDYAAATVAAIAPMDNAERFTAMGLTVIRQMGQMGQFLSPRELRAGDHVSRARRFVIATGAKPVVPEIPGLAVLPYLTNYTALTAKPKILGALRP